MLRIKEEKWQEFCDRAEYVWVIKNEDGYFKYKDNSKEFVKYIQFSEFYLDKQNCEYKIDFYNLKDCKPVKIKMEVVE